MHLIYREATLDDIAQIQAVRYSVRENVLSNHALVTDAHYADYLTRRGRGWVCDYASQIVGFAIVDLQDRNVWALFLRPEWEGCGIGRHLLDKMLDWYFGQTKATLWLSTAPGTRAEGFYRRLGWNEAGLTDSGEVRFEMESSSR